MSAAREIIPPPGPTPNGERSSGQLASMAGRGGDFLFVSGLTAVDHISQSMQYEEMLSWLLFYSSLLDVAKTPQLDVIDPGGITRSQVVQTADGSLRARIRRVPTVAFAMPSAAAMSSYDCPAAWSS